MHSNWSTATSTVAERRQYPWPSTGEAEDAREGGERRRRSSGALGMVRSSLGWSECPEEEQPAPEKESCPANCNCVWNARNSVLTGGEAAGGGEREGGASGTCDRVRKALPTSAVSESAGGRRPVAGETSSGSRGLESPQNDPPELPRWSDVSCEDWREIR